MHRCEYFQRPITRNESAVNIQSCRSYRHMSFLFRMRKLTVEADGWPLTTSRGLRVVVSIRFLNWKLPRMLAFYDWFEGNSYSPTLPLFSDLVWSSLSSRARFPHVETVLEQLVQDPFREFFGSTLGPTIFGRLIHCWLLPLPIPVGSDSKFRPNAGVGSGPRSRSRACLNFLHLKLEIQRFPPLATTWFQNC